MILCLCGCPAVLHRMFEGVCACGCPAFRPGTQETNDGMETALNMLAEHHLTLEPEGEWLRFGMGAAEPEELAG